MEYPVKTKKSPNQTIPLTPMGVLTHGSAHTIPSARLPLVMSGIFSVHMSGGGLNFVEKSHFRFFPKNLEIVVTMFALHLHNPGANQKPSLLRAESPEEREKIMPNIMATSLR